ncbi:MAG: plasmid pRiA4b ORF-3 family protein [Streptosporangiaceae bacterium]
MNDREASAWQPPLTGQMRSLVAWVGTGRRLTQTGKITLADARHLVELLGTGDSIDPMIGDRVFKTTSSAELGYLTRVVEWAKAARLIRVTGNRLVPVKKNAALLDRPDDLVVALLEAYPKLGKSLFPRGHFRQSPVGDEFADISEALLSSLFARDQPCPPGVLRALVDDMIAERYILSRLNDLQLDALQRTNDTDVTIAVAALAALGVAVIDQAADTVQLTPLGRFAIGRLRGQPLPGDRVLQVKVTLADVENPTVWRRVLIPAAMSLDRLHAVIQGIMGWQNYHLHVLRIGELAYGPDPEDMLGFRDETRVRLADVADVGDRIGYEYDFGDGWEHELIIEESTTAETGRVYPVCLGGEGACPPEDSGGSPGYERLKEILADPSHEEYDDVKTWADSQTGGDFDPAHFDLSAASMRMITT